MDIEAAVEYPTNDEDWLRTVLIGGGIVVGGTLVAFLVAALGMILSVFTFGVGFLIVLPLILVVQVLVTAPVVGHYVEILRRTMRGDDRPPRFEDFGTLFKDGLYAMGIAVAYQLPFLALSVLAAVVVGLLWVVAFAVAGVGIGSDAASAVGFLGFSLLYVVMFAGMALWSVYSIVTAYLIPISVCRYARTGDVGAAFDYEHLKEVALSSEYAVPLVIVFGASMIINQFIGILNLLLVGFFAQFYLGMSMARLVGEGYADAAGIERDVPRSKTAESSQFVDPSDDRGARGD